MTRRVLFISFHFPPSAAVGGQRAVNFARGLSRLGWEPHVVTIRDEDVDQADPGRLRAIEGFPVHKARVLPTLAGLWQAAAKRARGPEPSGPPAARPSSGAGAGNPPAETIVRRVRRWLVSFLLLPDGERGWILPAAWVATRVIRHNDVEWMVTSCPPYSVHLVGLLVKRILGTRWAADFRDPWMTTSSKRLFPTSVLSLRVERWLERQVVERADLVLFNVQRLRDAYRARYAGVDPEKFIFIPNAVTVPAEVQPEPPKYEAFTIAYTGSLYVGRSPEPVFAAVARLIDSGRVDRDRVRIRLVGQCGTVNGVPTSAVARTFGLESVVEVSDPVPHAEALDIIRRSHLALLLAPGLPYQIPAKVYDYLGVGARILAIAEEGGTSDFVKQSGCGDAFDPSDVRGIAEFIDAEVQRRDTSSTGHGAFLARFAAERIADDLASQFQRVAAPQASAARCAL